MTGKRHFRLPHLLCAGAIAATATQAQDTGGFLVTFDVTPGLRYSTDSTTEDDLSLSTGLGLGLSSQTRAATFDASLETGLDVTGDGDGVDLFDPSARLRYSRENRDALLSAEARYRRIDLDEALFPVAPEDTGLPDTAPDLLRLDTGRRTDRGTTAVLEFGRTAPFGGRVAYDYDRTDYTDTADSTLRDNVRHGVTGQLNFRLDDRYTARLIASRDQLDVAEGGTDALDEELGAGLAVAVSPVLSADVSVAYTRAALESPDITTSDEGLSYALALNQALKNGAITVSFDNEIGAFGRRSTLTVGRDLALSEITALSFNVGVSQQNDFGVDPLFGLTFGHAFKRGTLNANVAQAYRTSDLGEVVKDTNARVSLSRPLTRTAGLSAGLSLRDRQYLSDGEEDLTRLGLSLSYTHTLTADWATVATYGRSLTIEDGVEDRTADTIFIGLERSFVRRP